MGMVGDNGITVPDDREFRLFQRMLLERLGIHLPDQKKALVSHRLWKRLQARHLSRFSDYYKLINQPDEQQELNKVLELLTTNETYFFREPRHFEFLREQILPKLDPQRMLRVWSAASSSGEEPYSIGMLLADRRSGPWELVASDVNQSMLDKARRAIYRDERTDQIPKDYRQRFCRKGTGPYAGCLRIAPELRQRVQFRQVNLNKTLPEMGRFDVVFLRNVMIYFDEATKREVLGRVSRVLQPQGWLFVGHSESLHGLDTHFQSLAPAIYQLSGGGHAEH